MSYLHNYLKPGEKIFSIKSHLRSYTYKAFVRKKTGQLLRVTAGCRCWKSFAAADAHYEGRSDRRPEWGDAYIFTRDNNGSFIFPSGQRLNRFVERAEVRHILTALAASVQRYKANLRKK